jgi:HTH-type transcriptional regulator / antitoxin HigA
MKSITTAKSSRRYLELVHEFPLRPIRSKRESDQAMRIVGRLATFDEGTLAPGEQDYFDALTILIEDYQRRHPEVAPSVTPLTMLKHLMEQRSMTISELGRIIGSQSNASLIYSGKRAISTRVMRLLGAHFSVSPAVFL